MAYSDLLWTQKAVGGKDAEQIEATIFSLLTVDDGEVSWHSKPYHSSILYVSLIFFLYGGHEG